MKRSTDSGVDRPARWLPGRYLAKRRSLQSRTNLRSIVFAMLVTCLVAVAVPTHVAAEDQIPAERFEELGIAARLPADAAIHEKVQSFFEYRNRLVVRDQQDTVAAHQIVQRSEAARSSAFANTLANSAASRYLSDSQTHLEALRAKIEQVNGGFLDVETSVVVVDFQIESEGISATSLATESAQLYFAEAEVDEPKFTDYQAQYRLSWSRQTPEDIWQIAKVELLGNGIGPLTHPTSEAEPRSLSFTKLAAIQRPSRAETPVASSVEPIADEVESEIMSDNGFVKENYGNVSVVASAEADMAEYRGYDYNAMWNYAKKHWKNYNGSYRTFNEKGGDCTNFISQIMKAGGWSHDSGWYRSHHNWWYNRWNQTYTWVGVWPWYDFARNKSGRTSYLSSIWNLYTTDVLQVDWQGDGSLDHTMFVSGRGWRNGSREIYLAYHSSDHWDTRLTDLVAKYPDALWYAHRT